MDTIILAAGLSTRMGGTQKMLLEYRGKSFIARVTEAALEVGNVTVVTGHEAEKVEAELSASFSGYISEGRLRYVRNTLYRQGQMTSALAGLSAINPSEPFFITVGDLPLLKAEHFILLNEHFTNSGLRCLRPLSHGVPGHPVIFSPEMRDILLECGKASMREALREMPGTGFFRTEDPAFRTDIDSPEELAGLENEVRLS